MHDTALDRISDIIKKGQRFLIVSHVDPDGDSIGSLLALGQTLTLAGKQVLLFNEGPVPDSLASLHGIDRIRGDYDWSQGFDAYFVLDCGNIDRAGTISRELSRRKLLINIDHHENNSLFGDLNLVDTESSSVGEIIYRLIKIAHLPMDLHVAEGIFVAIQTDTGSFRYDNTTKEAFDIAGEMMDWGVIPWKISRKVMDEFTLKKLRLLSAALETIELHHEGRVALMTITRDMLMKARADKFDSERFVDYPRFLSGVEVAGLIKEIDQHHYKFSVRSQDWVNVAELANHFGGGGHPKAAAFKIEGSLDSAKKRFLEKTLEVLSGR